MLTNTLTLDRPSRDILDKNERYQSLPSVTPKRGRNLSSLQAAKMIMSKEGVLTAGMAGENSDGLKGDEARNQIRINNPGLCTQ